MPRIKNEKRSSNGRPDIKKRVITNNGKSYTYWICQITTGYDKSGKQIQKTISRKTKAEVLAEVKEIERLLAEDRYRNDITKVTVKEWGEVWIEKYTNAIKDSTRSSYQYNLDKYIYPALGDVKLKKLKTETIQDFYNELYSGGELSKPLAPKTVKCIHGVLHKLLSKAQTLGMISRNPAEDCELRKIESADKSGRALSETAIKDFVSVIRGHVHENLFMVTLHTGAREGEILGLTWDDVDFDNNTITICKQLGKKRYKQEDGKKFVPTKSSKVRTLTVSDAAMDYFKRQRAVELAKQKKTGEAWQNMNLVFSNPVGGFLSYRTVYTCFKRIVTKMGMPDVRFHDLRHTYAMLLLKSGADIKTLQDNMGHATAAFSIQQYGCSTRNMKKAAAEHFSNTFSEIIKGS